MGLHWFSEYYVAMLLLLLGIDQSSTTYAHRNTVWGIADKFEWYCRTGFDKKWLLLLELVIEIMPIIPCMGAVFPFVGSQSLDSYHLYFSMVSKETVTFLLLSNLALQYSSILALNFWDLVSMTWMLYERTLCVSYSLLLILFYSRIHQFHNFIFSYPYLTYAGGDKRVSRKQAGLSRKIPNSHDMTKSCIEM